MGLILVQSERVYILFDSLKYFNRVSYLKNVALKAMISVLVASLWNFTNIFFETVFLCYFVFSIFHLLLRFSKNYLITVILFFAMLIGVFILNDLARVDVLSKSVSENLIIGLILFPFIYDVYIFLYVAIIKLISKRAN